MSTQKEETALVVYDPKLFWWNDVDRIWYQLKSDRCCHGEVNNESWCLRPKVYESICGGDLYCSIHAPLYLEEEAETVADYIEKIAAGVRNLRRMGLAVPPFAAQLVELYPDEEEEAFEGGAPSSTTSCAASTSMSPAAPAFEFHQAAE